MNKPTAVVMFKSGRMIEVPHEVFETLTQGIDKNKTISVFQDTGNKTFLVIRHEDVSCLVLRNSPVSISGALE